MPRSYAGSFSDYTEAGERLGIYLNEESSFEDFLNQYVKGTKGKVDVSKGLIEFNLESMYEIIMDEDGNEPFKESERMDGEEIEEKTTEKIDVYDDMFRKLKQAPKGGILDDKIRGFVLDKTNGDYTYRKGHERIVNEKKVWISGRVVFRPKYRKVKGQRTVINNRIDEVEDIIKLLRIAKVKVDK